MKSTSTAFLGFLLLPAAALAQGSYVPPLPPPKVYKEYRPYTPPPEPVKPDFSFTKKRPYEPTYTPPPAKPEYRPSTRGNVDKPEPSRPSSSLPAPTDTPSAIAATRVVPANKKTPGPCLIVQSGTHGTSITQLAYDSFGNVLRSLYRSVDGDSTVEELFTYDARGKLVEKTRKHSKGSVTTRYTLDAGGRPTAAVVGTDQRTDFEYDGNGRKTREKVSTGATGQTLTDTRSTYDAEGRLLRDVTTTTSETYTTTYRYDASGNKETSHKTNGRGETVLMEDYTYDAFGNVLTQDKGKIGGPRTKVVYHHVCLGDAALPSSVGAAVLAPKPPAPTPPLSAPEIERQAVVAKIAKGPLAWLVPGFDKSVFLLDVWGFKTEALYVVGSGGIHQSADGGKTWRKSSSREQLLRLWGSSRNDVYAVGGTIQHSADGGATWQEQSPEVMASLRKELSPMFLRDVCGTGAHVYAAGDNGVLLQSLDRGASWRRITLGTTTGLTGVWAEGNVVYVVGENDLIMSSHDAGKTWRPEVSGSSFPYAAIWGAPGGRDIYVAGPERTVLHSKGDGVWRAIALPVNGHLSQIWGTSGKDFYALVSLQNVLLHTKDGGVSWSYEEYPLVPGMVALWGASATDIYLVGMNGIAHGSK